MLIGPHIQRYSEPSKEWARRAPIVKILDDPGIFNDAPDSAIRIFRPYVGDNNRDVAAVLKAVDERLKGYRHPNLYVEPMNEPLPWEDHLTKVFFDQISVELHARGLKCAGPSWSVGNPEQDVFNAWVAEGMHGIDLLTAHAYWADKGFTTWAALRPLRLVTDGRYTGPWAITEGGRDNLSTPAFGEGGKGGWIKDGVSPEQYVSELMSFVAQNAEHRGFVGFTPFTGGPAEQWKAYDTDPLVPRILAYTPGPTPIPEPEPPPVNDAEIARIEAKYNMSHHDSDTVYLAELIERPDPPSIAAYGPADLQVLVSTKDGLHQAKGMGYAEIAFSHPAAFYPTQGQTGFFYAEVGDARCDGLGWAFGIPNDTAPHRNVVPVFQRRPAPEPPDPRPEPPTGPRGWELAFNDYARAHPYVGDAIGGIFYFPPDFICAGQESASHLLIYDGNRTNPVAGVHEIKRAI